jgi:hypothetical protein
MIEIDPDEWVVVREHEPNAVMTVATDGVASLFEGAARRQACGVSIPAGTRILRHFPHVRQPLRAIAELLGVSR